MAETPQMLVAHSFKLNPNKVLGLTDEKIIKLSKARLWDEQNRKDDQSNIRIIRHSIKNQPGIYTVVLGCQNVHGELETVEIEVIVRSNKKIFIFLTSLLVFIILAGCLWWYNSRQLSVSSGLPAATSEKMSSDDLEKYAQKEIDQSNVTVQVYPHIFIKDDGKTGQMYVQNVPINRTGQVATLKDKATGEVLYTSELLKPGYQVSKVALNKKIPKGNYQGLITLTFYDLKEEKQVGRANIAATIHVDGKT